MKMIVSYFNWVDQLSSKSFKGVLTALRSPLLHTIAESVNQILGDKLCHRTNVYIDETDHFLAASVNPWHFLWWHLFWPQMLEMLINHFNQFESLCWIDLQMLIPLTLQALGICCKLKRDKVQNNIKNYTLMIPLN